LINFRGRPSRLLLVILIGHVVLISLQVNTASGVRVFEGVTFALFSEVQRGVSGVLGGFSRTWERYVNLRLVREKNDELREHVADLQFRLQQERALAQRVRSLEKLLNFRRDVGFSTVSARVIAGGASPYSRTVTIDRGTGDGVQRDSAVVSPAGVVGRVVSNSSSRAARVQLLVDRSAAAGALIERTRAAGVVTGGVDQAILRMEYVSNLEDIQVGDVVVTSGLDGIYPKGFVIGEVEVVRRGSGLYKIIHVRPSVDFSDLEDILVVVHESAPPWAVAGGK